jgi:hypothetical protein
MGAKLEVSMKITNDSGEVVSKSLFKDIPDFLISLNSENFREDFNLLEVAILESRRDVSLLIFRRSERMNFRLRM